MSHPATNSRLDSPDRFTETGPGEDGSAAGSAWLDLHLRPFSRQSGRSKPFTHTGFLMQAKALRERLVEPGTITVLRGEPGIGRHALLDYVAQELGESLRFPQLKIRPDRDLAATLRRRYPSSPDPNGALIEMIGGNDETGARAVLVVNNAHLLGPNDLDTLLEQVRTAAPGAGIVLLAESSIEPVISALDSNLATSLFTVSLLPLRRNQLPDYIAHRLRAAGIYSRSPLGEPELRRIYRKSGGVPGRINKAAREVLEELYNDGHEDLGYGQVSGNPATTALLLSAALLLVTTGAWVWMRLDDRGPGTPQTAASRSVQTDPEPGPEPARGEPPVAGLVAQKQTPATSPTLTDPIDEQPPPAPDPEVTAAPSPAPAVDPAPLEAAAMPVTEPARPAPAGGATEVAEDEGGPHGPQWLLSQPVDSYALQVVAVHSLSAIEDLCTSIGGCPQAAWYTIERDGKTWYRMVVGPYPTRNDARSGIDELPAGLRDQKPWIRPMREIHAAISAGSRPQNAGN
jgi:DamX protein